MRAKGLLFIVALIACGNRTPVDPQVSAAIGDGFQMRVGQQISLDNHALRISFEAVPDDSRCPTQVTCVWAGDGRVRLTVSTGDQNTPIDLHTTLEPHSVAVHGYQIILEKLDPQPASTERLPQDRYTAHLKVTKR
jgi:hypothetical protein